MHTARATRRNLSFRKAIPVAVRKVYILPNLFTAASLFCGMLAIFNTFEGELHTACWLIVLAGVLDVFDGFVARLTNTTSSFGLQFDSLSDVVAFGAAPAVLAFQAFGADLQRPRLAAAVCALYAVCGALRLARFNVQALREESKTFLGLPIPGAALAVVSMIWVFEVNTSVYDWLTGLNLLPDPALRERLPALYPPVMVVIAYLMVSKVPYAGFKSVKMVNRQPFEILVATILMLCLLYLLYRDFDLVLFVGIWSYIVIGVICRIVARLRRPGLYHEPALSAAGPGARAERRNADADLDEE